MLLYRWWQYTPLVPAEAGVSLWVPVWSIEWFPGQPCTQRNLVLKNQKEKKGRKKEMRLSMISVLVWRGHIFKWIKLKTRLPAGQWCHSSLIPDVPGRVQGLPGQNLVSKNKKKKPKNPKQNKTKSKNPRLPALFYYVILIALGKYYVNYCPRTASIKKSCFSQV